jgi:hypothetical protein
MENVENALFIVMNLRKILSQFHETETDKNWLDRMRIIAKFDFI